MSQDDNHRAGRLSRSCHMSLTRLTQRLSLLKQPPPTIMDRRWQLPVLDPAELLYRLNRPLISSWKQ